MGGPFRRSWPAGGGPARATVRAGMRDVLLVADVAWVVDAVRAALDGGGYRVSVAADPEGAAGRWQEESPAAVLVDLQVGSRGGMAVVRDLRAAAQAAGAAPPPTVLLLDRFVDGFLARRAGADAWVRKPFGGLALRRVVDRLVSPAAAEGAGG